MFGGKYNMYLVANFPLSLTVKEFLKLVDISHTNIEWHIVMAHGVYTLACRKLEKLFDRNRSRLMPPPGPKSIFGFVWPWPFTFWSLWGQKWWTLDELASKSVYSCSQVWQQANSGQVENIMLFCSLLWFLSPSWSLKLIVKKCNVIMIHLPVWPSGFVFGRFKKSY